MIFIFNSYLISSNFLLTYRFLYLFIKKIHTWNAKTEHISNNLDKNNHPLEKYSKSPVLVIFTFISVVVA